MKKLLFLFLGIDFTVLTAYALYSQDMITYIGKAANQPWGLHSLVELALLLTMVACWMYQDAKKNQIKVSPFFVIMLLSGISGLFFYLWKRESVTADNGLGKVSAATS